MLDENQDMLSGVSSQVLFLEGATRLGDLQNSGLQAFGFSFIPFSDPSDIPTLIEQHAIEAILLDLDASDGQAPSARIDQVQRQPAIGLPMIAISQSWDIKLRLAAVKAGCSDIFPKPLDYSELARALEALVHPAEQAPYRVLVVEDSPTQAMYMSQLLEMGGMEAQVITEPLKVLDALPLFQPDLILMDLYMPECDGPELAVLIRMGRAYIDIPIVYLSSETDRDKQLGALRKAGDDFLTKGMEMEHLLASIRIRAERTRLLRSLARQDSLTGLLNHTALKGRLAEESIRAKRLGSPLSFVMVDIDHFKRVNDSFGHGVGDQVIQSLSLLMRRRLRRTDILGRYGGEEFGIILPDTAGDKALQVIDDLRDVFSKLSFSAAGGTVQATFSAGVASLESEMSAERLCEAADGMLYVAKRSGRNRVAPLGVADVRDLPK